VLGASLWCERARSGLRASGETARRRDRTARRRLTRRERPIALLVAEGGTNKDAAAQLFLSAKTVEYHLHKVFDKLEISSRAKLIRSGVSLGREPAMAAAPGPTAEPAGRAGGSRASARSRARARR
jgi:DNA-binding NarL/FixJ family response regulator